MIPILDPVLKTTMSFLNTARCAILPFTEQPADHHDQLNTSQKVSGIQATELFSFFTADIIKEEVVFTR